MDQCVVTKAAPPVGGVEVELVLRERRSLAVLTAAAYAPNVGGQVSTRAEENPQDGPYRVPAKANRGNNVNFFRVGAGFHPTMPSRSLSYR